MSAGPADAAGAGMLPGMPARLVVATPSRVAAWLDCPRLFRFRYVDRPPARPGPPRAHTSVGVSVHTALAGWWRLPPRARTPAAAGRLLAQGWVTAGFRDTDQCHRWRSYAQEMVQRYAAGLDPAADPVGVERTVAFPTAVMAASGRVDRIDDRGGGLVVVDYKTGARVPSVADARGSPALALYAVGTARTLRRACLTVELHHVPTGTVAAAEHTPDTVQRQIGRIEAVVVEYAAATDAMATGAGADEAFPPRPGPLCGWCDMRERCPDGRAAAPAQPPWAGLPAEPSGGAAEPAVPAGGAPAEPVDGGTARVPGR